LFLLCLKRPFLIRHLTLIAAFTLLSSAQARTLQWNECIELARQKNSDLQIATSDLKATEELETVSVSQFYPQVAGAILANQSNRASSDLETSGKSYSAQMILTQNLFAGFSDLNKLRQAKANTNSLRANLQIAKAKVSWDLKQAFEALRYSEAWFKLTNEIFARREKNLRIVELRFESGRENKGSVLLSQAYHRQAQYDQLQAQHQIVSAQTQLAGVLALEDSNITLTDTIPVHNPPLNAPDFAVMVLQIPDYTQLQSQRIASEYQVEIDKSNFSPSLDLTGSSGKTDTSFFPQDNNHWNLALTLTIPLFNGGRDWATTRSAAAKAMSASQAVDSARFKILLKLKQTYQSYIESVEKAQVDQDFAKAQMVRAEISRNKYNNGLMSFEDWDTVENDLIQREKNSLTSQRDRVLREADWEQAQGTGVIQ
jgi:outer membrane protein